MKDTSSKSTVLFSNLTRRDVVKGIGAAGVGAAGTVAIGRRASAQSRGPLTVTIWTNDDPAQTAWYQKRAQLFNNAQPNIKVDPQRFPAGELGKKVSVGFATGTAPEGFLTFDFFMPVWLDKNLLAPLDVQRLGYVSTNAFTDDHPAAALSNLVKDGKVYGLPTWFHAFSNWINIRHFKEVGLDPDKDAPQTWEQFGQVAKRLTIKDRNRFVRQGAKFAMHSPVWTMIQFNPILLQCGGAWFDGGGKCTVNNEAGVRAMSIRASLVREYGAEDPADSVATNPLPMMDWLRERTSMFLVHPVHPNAIRTQNPRMFADGDYRAIRYPGLEPGKGYATTYGFVLTVNAQASQEKQEALHDFYKFFMAEPLEVWKETAPFAHIRRAGGWQQDAAVTAFPNATWLLQSREEGVALPRTLVFNELADAMHRAVQKIVLNNADIQASLNEAAAEVDRATAAYRRA
jgi:multiple sugar transport system substrate-binding protein